MQGSEHNACRDVAMLGYSSYYGEETIGLRGYENGSVSYSPTTGYSIGGGAISDGTAGNEELEELNMRIMGLDYGSKTVGVAVCDPLGITAQAVETITRKDENKLRQTLARIEALAKEYGVEKFVLGYPKNMNNTVGDRAQKSEELKAALERRTGLPVELWDERLTTVAAERVLMESGVRREHRKESVDQIAAAMILQGYLDHLSMTKKEDGENNG